MSKLQPNFSWQKYEGSPEDYNEQFQYQLQQEHIEVANTTNTTIDDLSYFTTTRALSFAWVNMSQIFSVTLALNAWTAGGTVNTIAIPNIMAKFTIIQMVSVLKDGNLPASNSYPLPYIDVTTAANSIQMQRVGTNVVITSGGTNYSTLTGYVTIYYTNT